MQRDNGSGSYTKIIYLMELLVALTIDIGNSRGLAHFQFSQWYDGTLCDTREIFAASTPWYWHSMRTQPGMAE